MSHCDISLCVSVNSPSLASGSLHRVNSPLVTIENAPSNRFRGEASDSKRVKNFVKNQQQPPKCLLVCLQSEKCHHKQRVTRYCFFSLLFLLFFYTLFTSLASITRSSILIHFLYCHSSSIIYFHPSSSIFMNGDDDDDGNDDDDDDEI